MLSEIFLSLFAVTFLVAIVAFSAYGYLIYSLLKNGADDIHPDSASEFIPFLWKLLIYYIYRSVGGFFGIKREAAPDYVQKYDGEIRDAESKTETLLSVYRIFSTAYILFFILLICLFVVLIYMIVGPAL